LKVDFIHQANDGHKVGAIEKILAETGFEWEHVCYMGDDVVDLGALRRAGFAATVCGAIDEAKAMSHYVSGLHGGHGAVREVADLILKAQGKWENLVEFWSR
jgi:3-deoxy-D-manno-octulosonate 8-phosphate phosphatase (KDO 8-P phosphatase)